MEYSFSSTPQLSKAKSTLWYECKGLIKFLEGWCMYLITDLRTLIGRILTDIHNPWFKVKLTTFKPFKSFFNSSIQLPTLQCHCPPCPGCSNSSVPQWITDFSIICSLPNTPRIRLNLCYPSQKKHCHLYSFCTAWAVRQGDTFFY